MGGALLSVSAFNHEKAPMSFLQLLDALEANNWEPPAASKLSPDDTQHSESNCEHV